MDFEHVPQFGRPRTSRRARRLAFGLIGELALVVPSHAFAADWPQFHSDVAHTGVNPSETSLSSANVAGLTETWSASIGPGGESSPAVVDGVAYVGSDDGAVYAI